MSSSRSLAVALCVALTACAESAPTTPSFAPRASAGFGASSDPVVAAAGDIACAPGNVVDACAQMATSDLFAAIAPDVVVALGDNQYERGTYSEYLGGYAPSWGRYKAITRPVPGNHEYQSTGAVGYFDYFNGVGVASGVAGDRGKGWYSYNLGSWHVVALNSNCASVGGCGAGSAQEQWLRADLAANPASCTLAYWHHPRFSTGNHGNLTDTQALWQALYDFDAEVVLVGHDHDYERYARLTATGVRDSLRGLRQFVVGTGGKNLHPFSTTSPNTDARDYSTFGVLKLVLHPTSFDWQFVPVAGGTYADQGSEQCHGPNVPPPPPPPPTNQPPVAVWSYTCSTGTKSCALDATGSTDDAAVASWSWTTNDPIRGPKTGASIVRYISTSMRRTWLETLVVADAQGLTSTLQRVMVTPMGTNAAPTAQIVSPAAGTTVTAGQPVSLSGSGNDLELGQTGLGYCWTSNLDGALGCAQSLAVSTLRVGTHTLTLTVSDPVAATGKATVALTVVAAPPPPPPPPGNAAPTADFTWSCTGNLCTFTSTSSDPDGDPLTCAWKSSSSAHLAKTGCSMNRYTLSVRSTPWDETLTVNDGQGHAASVTKRIQP